MISVKITPATLAAKEAVLAANGITISSDKGQVTAHGCVLDYVYDGAVLQITTVSKPFYIAESVIDNELMKFLG